MEEAQKLNPWMEKVGGSSVGGRKLGDDLDGSKGGALCPKLVWPEHALVCFWCAVSVPSNDDFNLTKKIVWQGQSWRGAGHTNHTAFSTHGYRQNPFMHSLKSADHI